MNTEFKLWIIIIIVILITLRTFIDLFYSKDFDLYDIQHNDKVYDKYMFIKVFLDIPFVILSILLVFNIKYNLKIYLFLFFSIFYILIDHFFEYLYTIKFNNETAYYINRYYSLFSDIIMFTIGIYIIYKVFYVTN